MNLTACKLIYDIFQIHMSVFSGSEATFLPKEEKLYFTETMQQYLKENTLPVIYQEGDNLYYGLIEHDDVQYLIGPVSSRKLNPMELRSYQEEHHLEYSLAIKRMNIEQLSKILVLLYWNVAEVEVPYRQIEVVGSSIDLENLEWNSDAESEAYQLAQSEYDRVHTGGIEFENQILACVRDGDVLKLKKLMNGQVPNANDYSEVAKNNVKQMEYLVISTLTLITRAAVFGGMNPEDAYNLGDVYMRKIEECSGDVQKLTQIGLKAQREFTEKVFLAKKKRTENLHVEKCKDYIAKNLRKNIKVGDIAPNIGVSRTYLTHKFSELEGMTIQQYILKEKCDHAANLLKHSDYPISEIAEYFGFTSQSHFGSCFRRQFGMTPREFRIQNMKKFV